MSTPMGSHHTNDPQRNSRNQVKVCRDFVRGKCYKYDQCIFRHELLLNEMKDILIFCKDYQNKVCSRLNCGFLHSSIEEQEEFNETGKLPRVLAERHATISSSQAKCQGEMFDPAGMSRPNASVMLMPPPPPPPPPPPQAAQQRSGPRAQTQQPSQPPLPQQPAPCMPHLYAGSAAVQPDYTAPQQLAIGIEEQEDFSGAGKLPRVLADRHTAISSSQVKTQGEMFDPAGMSRPNTSVLLLPPPPPPPPPPPQAPQPRSLPRAQTHQPPRPQQPAQCMPHMYPGTSAVQPDYTAPQQPAMFDPTRPPPFLHPMGEGSGVKRKNTDCEAGHPKVAKSGAGGSCDECARRLKSLEETEREIGKCLSNQADLTLLYESRLAAFQASKQALKNATAANTVEDFGSAAGQQDMLLNQLTQFRNSKPDVIAGGSGLDFHKIILQAMLSMDTPVVAPRASDTASLLQSLGGMNNIMRLPAARAAPLQDDRQSLLGLLSSRVVAESGARLASTSSNGYFGAEPAAPPARPPTTSPSYQNMPTAYTQMNYTHSNGGPHNHTAVSAPRPPPTPSTAAGNAPSRKASYAGPPPYPYSYNASYYGHY